MYDFLEGRLAETTPTRVVLDVGGVGYDVAVPLGTHPATSEGRTRLWTHLVVREDAQLLYGFADPETRAIFRLLLQVRGVGPALALGVLSSLREDELLAAILEEDVAALTRIKGVGKKTAEQILLDLRDKAPRHLQADPAVLTPKAPAASSLEDAVVALLSIGYSEKEARKSVERAAEKVDPKDLELLVRTAISG